MIGIIGTKKTLINDRQILQANSEWLPVIT